MRLYEIDEKAAARAKEMTSLGEYVYGSETFRQFFAEKL